MSETTILNLAIAIDHILTAGLLRQKRIKALYEKLVEQMQLFNKREKDELMIDLAFRCFECLDLQNAIEVYVDKAKEFCSNSETFSTQSIGAYMLIYLAPKMQDS